MPVLNFADSNRQTRTSMLSTPDAPSVGIFLNSDAKLSNLLGQVQMLAGNSGVSAYLVGGPVRDHLLNLPVNDLDISVVGDAPALASRLADAVGGRLTVHRRFGTATVSVDGVNVDLVTARSETYPSPGALPRVRPGTIADDLARRDFTINAMALPLIDDDAPLVDPHGGRDDLDAGIIRALHPDSFRDDPTRTFRAARYARRLGFGLADDTLGQLRAAMSDGALSTISGDRVRHEFDRILEEADPLAVLRFADDLGILASVHPGLSAGHLATVDSDDDLKPLACLSLLVWPLSSNEAGSFAARINAPSDWARVVDDTVQLVQRLPQLSRADIPPSQVCALLDGLSPHALEAARTLASPGVAEIINRYFDEWWSVAPSLRGPDLLELGVPVGPAIGEALRALRRARLDGVVNNRDEEVNLARQWAE